MADEKRGGYREPERPSAAPGGPGKGSRRNDGGSLKETPSLDRRDVQHGDVQAIEQRMAARPLQGEQSPSLPVGTGPGGGQGVPQLAQIQGSALPGAMFGPSQRPGEPTTAGLAAGPGPGPEALNAPPGSEDFRTWKLRQLAQTFGNEDALEALQEMEQRGMQRDRAAMQMPAQGPVMDEIEDEDEVDLAAFEEEEDFEDEEIDEEMNEFGELPEEGEEEMLMAEEEAALAEEGEAVEGEVESAEGEGEAAAPAPTEE